MNKPNIILDLDQTLISSEPFESFDKKKHEKKTKLFKYKNMDDYYLVFERPGLQKFLKFLFKNFNVSVWTAATKDYALFIIENMILKNKKNRHLDYIFFSYHCDISKKLTKNSKDLSLLWKRYKLKGYSKNNTIILDDNDEVYDTQPNRTVRAVPFEFTDENSENDDFLKKITPKLKQILHKISKLDK
jgi:TFIIF-interacting CTD phosphatase-like protein